MFDPLDFLAEVSAHIPNAHEKTTLFYGWYSNRTRGYREQHGPLAKAEAADPVPGTDDRAPREVRRSWARLIRKVYEVDPLLCPRCGGTMKVVAVLERPAAVRQIRSAVLDPECSDRRELATKPRSSRAPHRSAQLPSAT